MKLNKKNVAIAFNGWGRSTTGGIKDWAIEEAIEILAGLSAEDSLTIERPSGTWVIDRPCQRIIRTLKDGDRTVFDFSD